MNDRTQGRGPESLEDREIRELLEQAGPRPEVPEEDLSQIKAAFRAEWEELVKEPKASPQRAASRRPALLLAAAVVAASLGLAWWLWSGGASPGTQVASVEAVHGALMGATEAGRLAASETFLPGGAVERGTRLELAQEGSGPAHASLRLSTGTTLRLNHEARIRLLSDSALELERGAVYLDTSGAEPGSEIRVHTALGVARDIGTRFEVRLMELEGGTALRVQVREGEVRIEQGERAESVIAEEELVLAADGTVKRSSLAAHAPSWAWTMEAAPALQIEGRKILHVLEEIALETGLALRFSDTEARQIATEHEFGAGFDDLPPTEESLRVLLPAADLTYERIEGELWIRPIGD